MNDVKIGSFVKTCLKDPNKSDILENNSKRNVQNYM